MKNLTLSILACLVLAPVLNASAAGDVQAGKAAFAKCASCHQVGPSARAAFGPQLNGIVGRKAGTANDFPYSAAMKNAGFVWSEEKLRASSRHPAMSCPVTGCGFSVSATRNSSTICWRICGPLTGSINSVEEIHSGATLQVCMPVSLRFFDVGRCARMAVTPVTGYRQPAPVNRGRPPDRISRMMSAASDRRRYRDG